MSIKAQGRGSITMSKPPTPAVTGGTATCALAGQQPKDQKGEIARLDQVSYQYGSGLLAVRNVDLQIQSGRNIAITGPSGCGKSTLLRIISGLRQPTDGKIVRIANEPDIHPLTMMFQEDTLLPWLTVRGNVRLHFRFVRRPRRYVDQLVGELLPLVGLEAFADAYPYQLSIGMRRRVAFLTAIAPGPRLLLLDEPFSALDEPTRVALHRDVFRVSRERGITIVMVTHDIAEALSLSDEVIVMSNRPGTVAARHETMFGGDRDVFALRESPEFLRLYGDVWGDLSRQMQMPPTTEDPT
jgi:NitT/TauT family transport system ATP-binding protein